MIMGWKGDVDKGWMRKVDQEIQRVGAKVGSRDKGRQDGQGPASHTE